MNSFRNHFPIFHNNPDLVYLDSAATTQKPQYVIDATNEYITNTYANIGRGAYSIAEKSDELYFKTKEKTGALLNAQGNEIIFTPNSTYAINTVALSLVESEYFQPHDEIILSIAEHHANILIRQQIAVRHCLTIKWIGLDEHGMISTSELKSQVTPKTKLVALTLCSNVLGIKNNLNGVRSIIGPDVFFLVDGSQAVPHYRVNVQTIECDALVFSTHKFFGYTGLGILYMKRQWSKQLRPGLLGGGTIEQVDTQSFCLKPEVEKFEPGTPNIISIVSRYYAMEYRDTIGGYDTRTLQEQKLMKHMSDIIPHMSDKLSYINTYAPYDSIGLYSFRPKKPRHTQHINQYLSDANICVRSGGHCAYPLAQYLQLQEGSIRISLHVYNTTQDLDALVAAVKKMNTK